MKRALAVKVEEELRGPGVGKAIKRRCGSAPSRAERQAEEMASAIKSSEFHEWLDGYVAGTLSIIAQADAELRQLPDTD